MEEKLKQKKRHGERDTEGEETRPYDNISTQYHDKQLDNNSHNRDKLNPNFSPTTGLIKVTDRLTQL